MERLTGHFELDVRTLDALLGVERCFDMIARDLVAGGAAAVCMSWTATATTRCSSA